MEATLSLYHELWSRREQRAALLHKTPGNAAPAAGQARCGKVCNGTDALVSVIVMYVRKMTPVAVEFVDTKCG